jgi:UDP-glucose 4-epimerase
VRREASIANSSGTALRSLVTGGSGFIGSALAADLLSNGHDVTVIDNLSSGRGENVAALTQNDRFKMVVGSCADIGLMTELIDGADQIFHLAAIVGVRRVLASPMETIHINHELTRTVLSIAAERGCPVVLVSSSEVYGTNSVFPYREDAGLSIGPPTAGRWSYACGKALDEFLALAYWRERGLPVVIARLFNTSGPRQLGQYGMVIPTFVQQALADSPIMVHGDGRQTRCFTHVSDVTRALMSMAATPSCRGEIFNVGSREEVSVESLAFRVVDCCNSGSTVTYIAFDEAYGPCFEEPYRRVPDISKVTAAIGWVPRISLEQIIGDVVAHVRAKMKGNAVDVGPHDS